MTKPSKYLNDYGYPASTAGTRCHDCLTRLFARSVTTDNLFSCRLSSVSVKKAVV